MSSAVRSTDTETSVTGELSAFQKFWQSKKNQDRIFLILKLILAFFVVSFSLFPILYTISAGYQHAAVHSDAAHARALS